MNSGVLVVVPMFNEEESILLTLKRLIPICEQNYYNVLIIDDGSSDNSYQVAKEFITITNSPHVSLMRLPYNCGVGAAMRTGFTWAHLQGYTEVVQFDADGQHDPSWIEKLVEKSGDFDVVVGSRFQLSEKFTSQFRRLTMFILSQIILIRTGISLTDPTSGFRLTGSRAIAPYSHQYPTEYLGDTLNSLVLANSLRLKVVEVPVKMYRRNAGNPSTGILKSSLYLVRSIFSMVIYQRPKGINE